MKQILEADQPTGTPFQTQLPFMVSLDTYADGWFLEYAVTKPDPTEMVWKRWHTQPLREHGDLSHVNVLGMKDYSYRMHGGTVGATAFRSTIELKVFK